MPQVSICQLKPGLSKRRSQSPPPSFLLNLPPPSSPSWALVAPVEPEPSRHTEGSQPPSEGPRLCGQEHPKSCLSGSGLGDPQATNIWTYQRRGGSPQSKCLPEVLEGRLVMRLSPLPQHSSWDPEERGPGRPLAPASHGSAFSFQAMHDPRSSANTPPSFLGILNASVVWAVLARGQAF